MSIRQRIEAVLFDVDGVVVESELLHLVTFNELLASLRIHITEKEWKSRFLGVGSDSIMKTLFEEHGITEDYKLWVDKRRALYREHVASGDLHSVPGFLGFYHSVVDAQLPIAFVSTGHPQNIIAALKSQGLEGRHPVVDGIQVTRLKPDPEAYLLGAQTLGVIPSRCLVFEDSPVGVTAAKAAKMWCVALTTTNPANDLSKADFIISNFKGWTITKILKKLNV
ncbi:MAG: HAD family hydrolase [Candidatus Odinarchaeota archaeon]